MIYRPPEREQASRGRMPPGREVASVLVLVALVLALLLPVAFPDAPLPAWPFATEVALVPPTPLSLPQPYTSGTGTAVAATMAPGAGFLTPTPDAAGSQEVPGLDPLPSPTFPVMVFPSPEPTVPDRFPLGLPTRRPSPTASLGYPAPGQPTPSPSPTLVTSTPSATATAGTPGTATVTATAGTPGTATLTPTPGTPTATPSTGAYPASRASEG